MNTVKNEIVTNDIRPLVDESGFVDRKGYQESEIDSDFENQVECGKNYIRECLDKRERFNHDRGSYGLKHDMEKFAGEYVSNGAAIVAMHEMGYRVKQVVNPGSGINALFNYSKKEIPTSGSDFMRWVSKQTKRKDAVGDLAVDMMRDIHLDKKMQPENLKAHLSYVDEYVVNAAEEMIDEYYKINRN